MPDEQRQAQHRAQQQCEDFTAAPGMTLAHLGDAQQQGGQAKDHQQRAQIVDHRLAVRHR
ncbi:hypothetical protein D3C76_1719530 [compost metagenome]